MLLRTARNIMVNSLEKITGEDGEEMNRENMTEGLRHIQIKQAL
jgi:hypothetical protein